MYLGPGFSERRAAGKMHTAVSEATAASCRDNQAHLK